MNIEIAEYSVFFTFPNLAEETLGHIKQVAQTVLGFDVEVGRTFLEFDYTGRDAGRKVVTFLCQAAPMIGTAEGEAECHITTDTDETYFEFYTIQHGKLYVQDAEIVRRPAVEVHLDAPSIDQRTFVNA